MDTHFRRLQLLSAAAFSYSHGTNDAQKTMGIITGVLVTTKYLPDFQVPIWVILAAHAAIGLGTLSGGWRIIHTMGLRITKLKPRGGFCAETAAAGSILLATWAGVGVSTTHVITGAIAGVGSIQRLKAVRWGVAANIVWAWVLTIPASAVVAYISYSLIRLWGLDPR
jgi:PiT family inorganic phosphate transporter